MNDSAGESENDLEEGIPEELEEDLREDLRESCDENISYICSKLSVSSSENLEKSDKSSSEKSLAEESSSSSFSKIVFTIPKDKNSGGSAASISEPKRLISLKIDESFFHLIPGSEEDISCASESHILQTTDATVILKKETSKTTDPGNVEDQGNFMFMYHGSEDDMDEEVTRHSGGSDASQEDVLSPAHKSTTPSISAENLIRCHIYSHPPRKAPLHSSCSLKSNVIKRETAGSCKQSWSDTACSSSYSKMPVNANANAHDVQLSQSCTEIIAQAEANSAESLAVVEESLLQEIEECLIKYFEATSSEEERFETKLSQLICNEPPKESNEGELSVEEESQESLDVESCDACLDSDSSEDEAEDDSATDSDDDSEEDEERQLKICLKKGCTNISCKKKKKKVFFLCNTEDYQKLLKEEDEDEEICNKDDASKRKSP